MEKADMKNFLEHRPVLHYSVEKGWMNDPNGLLYYNGYYHLYYQYYPNDIKHGPMHWGHARSKDLITWENLDTALYPDDIGVIFSGSMVADIDNTSGYGKNGILPLVAVFTHHTSGKTDYKQFQSIAYSLDEGSTFTKNPNNPVLRLDGQRDFRDPKVFWHKESRKWVMSLAVGRKIMLYGSQNLKEWSFLSEFTVMNQNFQVIWECPDLFPLKDVEGNEKWILVVSVNSDGGEYFGMQYFVGSFDGTDFMSEVPDNEMLMLDKGYDNYAAVTYNGLADRVVMIGWMNCWYYGEMIPVSCFRGSMTIPRELSLTGKEGSYRITQTIIREMKEYYLTNSRYIGNARKFMVCATPFLMDMKVHFSDFKLVLTNSQQTFNIWLDTSEKVLHADRRGCGHEELGKIFYRDFTCPVTEQHGMMDLVVLVDVTSVEIFACNGEAVITLQYFIDHPFDTVLIEQGEASDIVIYTLQEG